MTPVTRSRKTLLLQRRPTRPRLDGRTASLTDRRFATVAQCTIKSGPSSVAGGVVLAASVIGAGANLLGEEGEKGENEVSPPEDLMREHGVLKRILLVYGEALRRMEAKEDLPPEPIADAAKIIRDFVEDYHEKLEENFLFPRFKKPTS